MAKTQEELTQLKIEYETLCTKLQELSEDELKVVTGGVLGDPIEVGLWYGEHNPVTLPGSHLKLYYYCNKVLGDNLYSFIMVACTSLNGDKICTKVGEKQSAGHNFFKATVPIEVSKCIF